MKILTNVDFRQMAENKGRWLAALPGLDAVPHPNWEPWIVRLDNLTIEHPVDHYGVDLEQCFTSAQVLDWIFQVQGKVWASNADMGALLEALYACLDPQAKLCSFGGSGEQVVTRKLVEHNLADYLWIDPPP